MLAGIHSEFSMGGPPHFSQLVEEDSLAELSFVLLEGGVGSTVMIFLSFPIELHALIICGRDHIMPVDPGPP